MAIKISGTTVIDDSRNIQNVGVVTATSFSGSGSGLTGVITTGGGQTIGGNLTVSGDLTVNGTQTIINTTTLDITDKTVGIASTATPSDSYADGAGIVIYGSTNKTLTWDNANSRMAFSTDVYAARFYGSGANLTGLPQSGIGINTSGGNVGYGATLLDFRGAGVSTITYNVSAGIATINITGGGGGGSSGLTTEASSGGLVTLNLSAAQDHKVTATGITTITVSGGTEGESHTVRIVNSGIATVGFSTYFLFPSGSPPSLPTASGTINLISFTVHRVGTAGTQLLAGAGLNYQ